MASDRICVGAFNGAFGVHGEVRLKSFCADPAAIADYTPLYTEADRCFTQIVLTGQITNGFSARIDGVITKEDADQLKGISLYAERAVLPHLPDDEYYYTDLIGLSVFDSGGADRGVVKSVANHGAGDLLEITPRGLIETVLLPFTQAAVPTVDLAQGRIIIDPPLGLFEKDVS
jgi:16S rRNA processing protein RimM